MNEDRVAECAILSLQKHKPFSAIRLGDGEGRILLWPDGITREQINKHLVFWFGYHSGILNSDLRAWKRMLQVAVSRADAVGFYHGEERNRYWRAVQENIELRADVIECENSLHRELWEGDLLQDIVHAAQHVVLVTCRDVPRGDGVEIISIPEEGHTSGERSNHPERFGEFCTMVHNSAAPGTLVLVGGGLFGKIYCDVAREAGAVALDIGSVFDALAGVKSRSYLTGELKRYTIEVANASADSDLQEGGS